MNMPSFTAESSLYKTRGRYWSGRHIVNSLAQTGSAVRPALEQEGEVIHVHSCPPGWTDYGGTCFPPPVTEPPTGGAGGNWPIGDGPTDGGYGGGAGTPPKKAHECNKSDFGGSQGAAAAAKEACRSWGERKGISNVYIWCVPTSGGRTAKSCCYNTGLGTRQCLSLAAAQLDV